MYCLTCFSRSALDHSITDLIGASFGRINHNIHVNTVKILAAVFLLFGALASSGTFAAGVPLSDLDKLFERARQPTNTVDVYGQALSAEALRDRLTVVSFVSVGCTNLCVTRTMDLNRLARDLPVSLRGRVVFLAIDTDPAADDAPHLRAFADGLLGPEPQVRFLPSDAHATKAMAADIHYPEASLPELPSTILLFDRRGRIAMSYGGDPLDIPRLARDLAVLDAFTQGLGNPPAEAAPTR